MTTVTSEPETRESINDSDDDDLIHFSFIDNPDRAYCGEDLTNQPFVSDGTQVTCSLCIDLALIWSEDDVEAYV